MIHPKGFLTPMSGSQRCLLAEILAGIVGLDTYRWVLHGDQAISHDGSLVLKKSQKDRELGCWGGSVS